jgi:membrane-bound lytic murein transglycosylase B
LIPLRSILYLYCRKSQVLVLLAVLFCWQSSNAADREDDFSQWLSAFRVEALSIGISTETFDRAIGSYRPLKRIVELDRSQPEFIQTVQSYISKRVTPGQLSNGYKQLRTYPTWFGRVENYGVPRRYLVALWGIESNYGRLAGDIPVVQALLTLAFDGRRGAYFSKELLCALQILEAHSAVHPNMVGSWAGAMGQCQFMPSSYLRFAVDADGNGLADIWSTVPDVIASAANYLQQSGWQTGQRWGRPVRLPGGLDAGLFGLDKRLSLKEWSAKGVRREDGRLLPIADMSASLIQPDGSGSQAYLVYDNFRVILKWNSSVAFGLAVGTLADGLENSNDWHSTHQN